MLLLACIHFEALNEADNPLGPYLPSCGGTDEADPTAALAKFLADPAKSFYENLSEGRHWSFFPMRGFLWMMPAAYCFVSRSLQFYLVEVDCGAGLNLVTDMLYPVKGFDPSFIATRVGLDAKPLEMPDIMHRRWVTACLMPDDVAGIQMLDRAADAVAEIRREDPSTLQLVPCPAAKALKFISKNIPADESDVGLLVMNQGVTGRMGDEDYGSYGKAVAETLAPWGDRGLWVEVEHVRGEMYSTTYQLRVHRIVDGSLCSAVLTTLDFENKRVTDHPEALAFLGYKPKPLK